MKCYYCAAEIPDDSERCPRCRQAVKKVKSDREIAREKAEAAKAAKKAAEAAENGEVSEAAGAQVAPVPAPVQMTPPPPPPAPIAPPNANKPVPQRFQDENARFKRGTMIGDLISWWQMPHFRMGLAAILGSCVLIGVMVVALSYFA